MRNQALFFLKKKSSCTVVGRKHPMNNFAMGPLFCESILAYAFIEPLLVRKEIYRKKKNNSLNL